MNNLTKGLGDEFKGHSPEAEKALLEGRKLAEALSKGDMELPEEIRHEMDRSKQAPYDTGYNDTQCHGCDVNKKFGRVCTYQKGNECQLRAILKGSPKNFPNTNYCLMPGIYMNLPAEFDAKIANLIPPGARVYVLRLYDHFLSYEIKIMKAKRLAKRNGKRKSRTKGKGNLASLRTAQDTADRKMSTLFKFAYEMTYYVLRGERAPTAEEFRDAYEVDQYQMRLEQGEPVIFENGRCMFDGYVVSQGYLPGPFPGMEFWTTEKGPVDPRQFAKWLEDTKPERERSKLPPVGYTGCPVCNIYAIDMLKFFADTLGVAGPETYKAATGLSKPIA